MCKLSGWTSSKTNPLNAAAANRALLAAHKIISKTEQDGFGFSQPSARGLHGRFIEPKNFRGLDSLPRLFSRAGDSFDAFEASWNAEQTGKYHAAKPVIIHGRTATCGVSLNNCHPFRHDGWTMAHNGVVSWGGEQSKLHKNATCDSQHILYCLTDGRTSKERKALLESIQGYAAFIAHGPRGEVIVARDDTANLYAGITKSGRWLFGTTAAIVDAVADAMNCRNVDAFRLDDYVWLEFAPDAPRPTVSTWHHAAAVQKQWKHASASLGSTWASPSVAQSQTKGDPFPDWEPRITLPN